MIQLKKITFKRDGTSIIKEASLTLKKAQALCVSGPSGIGKSTLLEIAAGLIKPNSGQVVRSSNRMSCVFQDDILVPWLTALDNILLVMQTKESGRQNEALHWLEYFELPPNLRPNQMSGGMRRRLNLARAFAVKPEILFLDEPFAFLDTRWQEYIASSIEAARSSGTAIFMTSHQACHLNKIEHIRITLKKHPIELYNDSD